MKKREIELKILNIDKKKVVSSLKKIGAKEFVGVRLIKELYLDVKKKEREFSSFRLREEGKKTTLTIKIKKDSKDFLVRDEYEIEVSSFETAKQILTFLGITPFRVREKKRHTFRLGNTYIEIDEYPKMNPYLEIEAENRKEVNLLLKSLGFPLEYTTNRTASEIIRDAGLDPDYLVFEK